MLKRKRNYKYRFDDERRMINENIHRRKSNQYKYKNIAVISFLFIVLIGIIIIKALNNSKNVNKNILFFNDTSFYNISNNITINKNISNLTNIIDDIKINQSEFNNKDKNKFLARDKALENGILYMNQCKEGKLINNNTLLNFSDNPKISVTIPVYNCQNTLVSAIRSIQNQNMENIEIILVDDFSNDETKAIIERMREEDKRIKVIHNNKNMGTFYSRSVGALLAKGKYITTLDNDDLFLDKDVFSDIYVEAEEGNYDIIKFKVFEGDNFNDLKDIKDNYSSQRDNSFIINQPDLGIYPISRNNSLHPNDIYIWGKLINAGVYKASVNILGKERYSTYIVWVEDTSIFFIICNIAESFKFITKYGLFHFISASTASIKQSHDSRSFAELFLLDIMFDFSKNSQKKYAAYKLMYIKDYSFFNLNNENIKEYLKKIVKKIMICEYIDEEIKKQIRLKFKGTNVLVDDNNYSEIIPSMNPLQY